MPRRLTPCPSGSSASLQFKETLLYAESKLCKKFPFKKMHTF